ncbi:MAG: aldehyde dehydrogenase, partial [Nonomuraea muscovyensis]|nr:aldehyde dehydrogenase [Nonomuraea muscovyensis]
TGRHLQSACLELGGKNPMVIMPDADLELAVEGALFSGFGTAGQRCTSLGTVIVHESVHGEFVERFARAVREAAIGEPAGDVLAGPLLDQKFADRYEEYLTWIQPHHEVVSGPTGRITADNPRGGFTGEGGLYYHPVVVDGVRPSDQVFLEETFGPIVGVTTFRTLDEALELANLPGYGLSSSIYTTDAANAFRFREGVSAGMVSVNNSTSGAEAHLPFGGNGKSGNGSRQSGMWVLEQFTRWHRLGLPPLEAARRPGLFRPGCQKATPPAARPPLRNARPATAGSGRARLTASSTTECSRGATVRSE